jgi:hypothetical protein
MASFTCPPFPPPRQTTRGLAILFPDESDKKMDSAAFVLSNTRQSTIIFFFFFFFFFFYYLPTSKASVAVIIYLQVLPLILK